MSRYRELTAIIEKDADMYVSLCPELDIASQGSSIESAKSNLVEAIELFFEHASDSEVQNRLRTDVLIARVQVSLP